MATMMPGLGKSQSVPGLLSIGVHAAKKPHANHHRKATLSFRLDGPVDLHRGPPPSQETLRLAEKLKDPAWRFTSSTSALRPPRRVDDSPGVHKNLKWPRSAPSWLKNEGQVLRFYAHFGEEVTNVRPEEAKRIRHCEISFFMEDGTCRINEPKVENSGLTQGLIVKRHRIPKSDGMGYLGPTDFAVGNELHIYGRNFRIHGCDSYTRWYFEDSGIILAPDVAPPEDEWTKRYKTAKALAASGKMMLESKRPQSLTQFLEHDGKVLRFKLYWDDHTPYGARIYAVGHYYLADNTFELNEAHTRNSGRDNYPIFYRRAKLNKVNFVNCYPGMLEPDPKPYLPQDFIVGQSIDVWGRKFWIYDCDEFTRSFYLEKFGVNQAECKLDVHDPPVKHLKLEMAPHNGIGDEEDTLLNCNALEPKQPRVDIVRLMTLSGKVLRFEAKLVNGQPEDEVRRLVIGFFPADDHVAVWEVQQRNSGFTGGKFCEKRRMKNPDTGGYFKLADFAVGKTVTINAHPLHIFRADEHSLRYAEAHPEIFPYADPQLCIAKLAPLVGLAEFQDSSGIEPEVLRGMANEEGVELIDHEIITLLRTFGVEDLEGMPRVSGPKVLAALATSPAPP